ncbi:MAG: hypothetical protein HY094_09080 [Candidatus Melainabacteria bacterium]|nr:hypothetical protein [Candidatus Melainabacteria bacterium]
MLIGTKPSSLRTDSLPQSIQKKKEISFKDLYLDLQKKGFKNVSIPFSKKDDPSLKKIYTGWGHAVVGEGSVALGTDGIASCAVLKVIDPTAGNLHYMLHAYQYDTEPDDIKKSLIKASSLGINLKDSEIEIMPGSQIDSLSTPHILEAIYKVNPSLINKVVLIRDFELQRTNSLQSLVAYKGDTYKYTDQFAKHCYRYMSTSLSKDRYKKVL